MKFKRILYASLIALLIIQVTVLAACSPGGEISTSPGGQAYQGPSNAGSPGEAPQPSDKPVDEAMLRALWQTGSHANTYVLSNEGTNSTCARCHAPVNWVPSMDDIPESCATCKFEVEPPPPVIAEPDWQHIQCNVCHQVNKREKVDPEFKWLEIAQIEEYTDVASSTELCQKCHVETTVPDHVVSAVAGVHSGYECTQCHDAHATTSSCTSANCHAEVLSQVSSIPGHDPDHESVSCVACHDAGSNLVGPDEQGYWLTLLSDMSADSSLVPFTSHNLQLEVLCERCHYLNNPWGLSPEVSKVNP